QEGADQGNHGAGCVRRGTTQIGSDHRSGSAAQNEPRAAGSSRPEARRAARLQHQAFRDDESWLGLLNACTAQNDHTAQAGLAFQGILRGIYSPLRPDTLATVATSSDGSTGLETWTRKP